MSFSNLKRYLSIDRSECITTWHLLDSLCGDYGMMKAIAASLPHDAGKTLSEALAGMIDDFAYDAENGHGELRGNRLEDHNDLIARFITTLLSVDLERQDQITPGNTMGFLRGNRLPSLTMDLLFNRLSDAVVLEPICQALTTLYKYIPKKKLSFDATVNLDDRDENSAESPKAGQVSVQDMQDHPIMILSKVGMYDLTDVTVERLEKASRMLTETLAAMFTNLEKNAPLWPLYLTKSLKQVCELVAHISSKNRDEACTTALATVVVLRYMSPFIMTSVGPPRSAVPPGILALLVKALQKTVNGQDLVQFNPQLVADDCPPKFAAEIDAAIQRINKHILETLNKPCHSFLNAIINYNLGRRREYVDPQRDAARSHSRAAERFRELLEYWVGDMITAMATEMPLCTPLHLPKLLNATGYCERREELKHRCGWRDAGGLNASMVDPSPGRPSILARSLHDPPYMQRDSTSFQGNFQKLVKHGCRSMHTPAITTHAHQFATFIGLNSDGHGVLLIHGSLLAESEKALAKDPNRTRIVLSQVVPNHKGVASFDGDVLAHLAVFLDLFANAGLRVVLVYVTSEDCKKSAFNHTWLKTVLSKSSGIFPSEVLSFLEKLIILSMKNEKKWLNWLQGKIGDMKVVKMGVIDAITEMKIPKEALDTVRLNLDVVEAVNRASGLSDQNSASSSLNWAAGLQEPLTPRRQLSFFLLTRQLLCVLQSVCGASNNLGITSELLIDFREDLLRLFAQWGQRLLNPIPDGGSGEAQLTPRSASLPCSMWGPLEEASESSRQLFEARITRLLTCPETTTDAHHVGLSVKCVPLRTVCRVVLANVALATSGWLKKVMSLASALSEQPKAAEELRHLTDKQYLFELGTHDSGEQFAAWLLATVIQFMMYLAFTNQKTTDESKQAVASGVRSLLDAIEERQRRRGESTPGFSGREDNSPSPAEPEKRTSTNQSPPRISNSFSTDPTEISRLHVTFVEVFTGVNEAAVALFLSGAPLRVVSFIFGQKKIAKGKREIILK